MSDDQTALIPRDPKPVALTPRIQGLVGFTSRELGSAIPDLQIIHSLRKAEDVGRPGQLKIGTTVFEQGVEVVILKVHKIRTLTHKSPDDDFRKAKTPCASSNGLVPLPDIPEPMSRECTVWDGVEYQPRCEYAKWTDGPGGKRIPPACDMAYALLCLLPGNNNQPCWFRIKNWQARRRADDLFGGMQRTPGITALHELKVKIAAELTKNAQGAPYYVPIFTVTGPVPFEEYAAARDAADQEFFIPRFDVVEAPSNGAGSPPAVAGDWDVPV